MIWLQAGLVISMIALVAIAVLALKYKKAVTHHQDRARRLAEALAYSNDGIWEWDLLNDSAYFSSRASWFLGQGKVPHQPSPPREWIVNLVDDSCRAMVEADLDLLFNSTKSQRFTIDFKTNKEAGRRWVSLRGKVIVEQDDDRASKMAGTLIDIGDTKRYERKLIHRVMHDPLTGLPNRALLSDRLQQQLAHSQRTAEPFSLLVLDLNRFKEINDSLGHAVGDELLKSSAGRLSDLLRESDTVARLGGDEFAVLLPNCAAPRACSIAENISDELSKPFLLHEHTLFIGASTGVAVYPEHGNTYEMLMQRADLAMYTAKRGNLGYTLYTAANDPGGKERIELENDLRQAIVDDGLTLHYQPKIHVGRRKVSGVEALIRWTHEKHGEVSPGKIADLAEKSGLIHTLTAWVVKEAFKQIALWRKKGIELPVSINLSVWNIQNPGFVAIVRRALAESGVPAELVEFEITESAMIVDPSRAHRTLDRLSELGLSFSVDDFGTGFSSLAYLQRLPVGTVKIDRSFVMDMHENEFDRSIVQSTIDMAHNLGLKAVAEGVEELVQYSMLAEMQCDELQGFLFTHPLCAIDLEIWLQASEYGILNDQAVKELSLKDTVVKLPKVS